MSEGGLALLARVATALGDLRDRVVFIGGAVAPLLQVDRPFAAPRPTGDVDAIILTANYSDFDRIREELRTRGFTEKQSARHAHKWVTPGPIPIEFDLVPAGSYLGSSGNPWDTAAVETAVETELRPGLVVLHASAPGFLALKLAAFHDRGKEDPHSSSDLEDIFALLASRPDLPDECGEARTDLRKYVAAEARNLLGRQDYADLQAGHLSNVYRARTAAIIPMVKGSLQRIAAL